MFKEVVAEISFISLKNIFWSIVFIAAAVAVWIVIGRFRDKIIEKIEETKQNVVRRKATVSTVCNAIKLILIIFTVLAVLQVNGVNVSSVVAGLGIASALAALAVQDIVKDLVQGLRILSDGYFSVGDCILFEGGYYQVIEFSIRTTKLKSLEDDSIKTLGNRNISEVTKLTGKEILKIPVAYEADTEEVDKVFTQCCEEINKVKGISKCKYYGLNTFEPSAINYLFTFNCKPVDRYNMRRAAMRVIRKSMKDSGLEVPYTQVDLHQK